MGPIDYTAGQTAITDSLRSLQGGLQLGAGIQQAQQQQAAQELAQQRAAQYQTDTAAFYGKPTAQGALALSLKYPDQAKPITEAFGAYTADQQKVALQDAATLTSLLHANRADLATKEIGERIQAAKNSGLPTDDLEALQSVIDSNPTGAYAHSLHILSALPGGDKYLANLATVGKTQQDADDSAATVAGKQADNAQKKLVIVGQGAGALAAVPNLKPTQAATFFRAQVAKGLMSKEDGDAAVAGVPTNPKDIPAYLNSFRDAGMTAKEQKGFTTPDANAQLQAQTSRYSTDSAARTADARLAFDKEQAAAGDDVASLTGDALDNAAARYNIDGTLPPMGMGAAASAGRTKILNRAAELKVGISGEDQRRQQLNNKADIANKNKAISAFTSGKQGNAIRSFNVLLTHLDTLDSLSDALDNGNIQAVNRLGNAYAKATGKAAPTNFEGVKHIVGDELVKAVTGGAGALGDREAIAATINSANSLPQLKGMIHNYKELAVGQLTGLEGQYKVSTGLNDFEHLLSPAARLMRNQHGGGAGAAGAPAGTAGKVVDFGSLK